jgi:hypothetical protein
MGEIPQTNNHFVDLLEKDISEDNHFKLEKLAKS